MNGGFAVVVEPAHAAGLVRGWPDGAWLVAIRPDDGPDRWEACHEPDIPGVLGGIPVWPPNGALAVADVSAEEERDLVESVLGVRDLAEAASRRLAADRPPWSVGPELGDIDW